MFYKFFSKKIFLRWSV